MKFAYVFIFFVLSGCAMPTGTSQYFRPDTSAQQTNTDYFDCEYKSNQMGRGNVLIETRYELECMNAKGYQYRR